MQTGETLIEVKDLCKHFRDGTVKALDGVDLTIRKGDVIVTIGPIRQRQVHVPALAQSCLKRRPPAA